MVQKAVQEGNVVELKQYLANITKAANGIESLLKGIDVPSITTTINDILTKLIETITTAEDVLKKPKRSILTRCCLPPNQWSAMP